MDHGMKRGLQVLVVLIVVSAAAGSGWVAGQRVKSPDQVAFEAEPPAPSLITVGVQLVELSADVIVRADVGYDDPVSLKLSGALGGLPPVLVVTAAPDRSAEIIEGSVAIEISGRPVFLLEGEIPVFRDLRPKAVGPDVLQLEEALARLGYFDGEPDQEWDRDTGTAAAAWYESRGYEPNGVSDDEQRRLDQADDRVDTAAEMVEEATDRVDAALDQVDTAEKGVERAEKGIETAEKGIETAAEGVEAAIRTRSAAEDAVSRARDRLDETQAALVEAEQGPDELEIRLARSEVLSAAEQVELAAADAESRSEEADQAILEAEAARESAARAYSLAESRWQSGQTGVHPDGGTVATASQMEDLRLAVRSAERALEAAERGIEQARAARDRKLVEAGSALRAARDRLVIARDSLDDLLAPPDTSSQQRAAEDAQLGLDMARSDLDEARSAVDDAREGVEEARSAVDDAREGVEEARSAVDDAREGVEDARSDLEDARSDLVEARQSLAELESETGIWIPAGELIFLERLPVRVDLLTAERGSSVSGAFMTVTGSDLAVRGSVAVRDVSLVKEGGDALLDDALLPEPLAGRIRLVEDRPGTRGVANDRHYLEIVADAIPDELIGKNIKVVIPVGGTDGEVLAVPAAALSATADGATRVEVEQPDGSTRFVEVEPGLAASGLVEVTPLDGQLREGDLVVVGLASDG